MLDTIGFDVVPATAGHVSVAEPDVAPSPVTTQPAVPATPQVKVPALSTGVPLKLTPPLIVVGVIVPKVCVPVQVFA